MSSDKFLFASVVIAVLFFMVALFKPKQEINDQRLRCEERNGVLVSSIDRGNYFCVPVIKLEP